MNFRTIFNGACQNNSRMVLPPKHGCMFKVLEPKVHGRGRNPESMEDLFFGVHDEMLYARKTEPVEGIISWHFLAVNMRATRVITAMLFLFLQFKFCSL